MTAAGAARLEEELAGLRAERGRLAAATAPDEWATRTKLDARIAGLAESLRTMQVLDGPPQDPGVVRVGATVRVRDAGGEETTFRLVGVDETDPERNWIAWVSPAARALLNARVGQTVTFRRPAGATHWQILQVSYD